jgi:hypothetical protein
MQVLTLFETLQAIIADTHFGVPSKMPSSPLSHCCCIQQDTSQALMLLKQANHSF